MVFGVKNFRWGLRAIMSRTLYFSFHATSIFLISPFKVFSLLFLSIVILQMIWLFFLLIKTIFFPSVIWSVIQSVIRSVKWSVPIQILSTPQPFNGSHYIFVTLARTFLNLKGLHIECQEKRNVKIYIVISKYIYQTFLNALKYPVTNVQRFTLHFLYFHSFQPRRAAKGGPK